MKLQNCILINFVQDARTGAQRDGQAVSNTPLQLFQSWLLCLVWILVSRDCCVAMPRGTVGLSAVCDCGISRSYSLFWGAKNHCLIRFNISHKYYDYVFSFFLF